MTRFDEVVDMTFGLAFKSKDFTDIGTDIRLLRGDNIAQGNLRWNGAKRFPARRSGEFAHYQLAVGDVVLAMDRPWIEAGLKYSVVREADIPSLLVQRVARLRAREPLDQGFLGYVIGSRAFTDHVIGVQTGSAVPHISGSQIAEFEVGTLPPIYEQRGIAATLGALDDKIESNRRACDLLRGLGKSMVKQAGSSRSVQLRELTRSISRGVTPKYADNDSEALVVLNQKCVRDNWVSTGPARRMVNRPVAQEKRVCGGDVLVNSTGTGTLGRVARWHAGRASADSHISIVKPDSTKIGPTLLAYLMFEQENNIEGMATGSTGQTELSPIRLGDLVLEAPRAAAAAALEPALLAIENRAVALRSESAALTRLRDTLLPELLSGRIRVPEAREVAESAL